MGGFDRHRKGGHGFSEYNRRVRITEGCRNRVEQYRIIIYKIILI